MKTDVGFNSLFNNAGCSVIPGNQFFKHRTLKQLSVQSMKICFFGVMESSQVTRTLLYVTTFQLQVTELWKKLQETFLGLTSAKKRVTQRLSKQYCQTSRTKDCFMFNVHRKHRSYVLSLGFWAGKLVTTQCENCKTS